MAASLLDTPLGRQDSDRVFGMPRKDGRMYAISFDLDIESLRLHYGEPYNNAHGEIRKVLQSQGFNWQQGSVYFGGETINAVTCVLVAI